MEGRLLAVYAFVGSMILLAACRATPFPFAALKDADSLFVPPRVGVINSLISSSSFLLPAYEEQRMSIVNSMNNTHC